MAVLGDTLFLRGDGVTLADVLRRRATEELSQAVIALPASAFLGKDEEIAVDLASRLRVEPLKVEFEKAKSAVRETTVDVSHRFDYGFPRDGQAPGLEVSKSIPFKGDQNLWHFQPSSFDSNPPRAKIIGRIFQIGIEILGDEPDSAVNFINSTIEQIKIYLARQEEQLKEYNEILTTSAVPYIEQRRARLGNAADVLRKLGG